MVRVIRSIWIWSACATLVLLWVPIVWAISLFDRDPGRRRTGRWFRRLGRNVARVNPWRLHISGAEKIRPGQVYVVVSNHQSLADIPLICFLRLDTKWLAKAELFRFPAIGALMRMAGDIPVYRGDRQRAADALIHAANAVRYGCSVVFFAEGKRSPGGEVLPFNDGPFRLALREKIPILPLVVDGSGAALPKHSWIFDHDADIYLHVLDPVFVDGLETEGTAELRDRVRQMIVEELQAMRAAEAAPAR